MILVISAIAGAYGAHLGHLLLSRTEYRQLRAQIIIGACVGALCGPVLGMMFPAMQNTLTILMSSLYLGTVLSQFVFGTFCGALAIITLGFAVRAKVDQ